MVPSGDTLTDALAGCVCRRIDGVTEPTTGCVRCSAGNVLRLVGKRLQGGVESASAADQRLRWNSDRREHGAARCCTGSRRRRGNGVAYAGVNFSGHHGCALGHAVLDDARNQLCCAGVVALVLRR